MVYYYDVSTSVFIKKQATGNMKVFLKTIKRRSNPIIGPQQEIE